MRVDLKKSVNWQYIWKGLLLGMLSLVLAACGEDAKEAPNPGAAGGDAAAQQKPEPVAVKRVRFGEAKSIFSTTATLEAEQSADVVARTTGIVRRIEVEEGDMVKKGQLLLTLDNETQKLDLKMAQIKAHNLEKEYERLKHVHEKGILSAQEFEAMANRLEEARANVEIAQLNLSHTQVRAPFSGRLTRRYLDEGANIQANAPLLQIMDTSPLLARIHIPANRMGSVRSGQLVQLRLDSATAELEGKLRLVSPIVDATAGTVKITAEISAYPAGTRPGDFVQVDVVTESHANAMLVDTVAVFEDKGEQILYIVVDGKAVRKVVKVGFVERGVTEILDGIDGSEWIVVKGQRNLREDAAVEVLEDASTESTAVHAKAAQGVDP